MKVIGKAGVYGDIYICEVSHSEIERFLNLYYNKLGKLKVGQEVDLAAGYEFHHKTAEALKKTQDFIKSHADVVRAITDGLLIIGRDDDEKSV
jgi:hypothetical protein